MSKVFRDSESLEKSNIKKLSQILLVFLKGVKLPRNKSLFLGEFCLTEQDLFGIGVNHSFLTVFCPHLPKSNVQFFLKYFWNLWGKVMETSGLRFENFCS